MRSIILNHGFTAIVDDADYKGVSQFKWRVTIRKNTSYAITSFWADGKSINVYMHHFIFGPKRIDHANGNGLDNQRINLRMCTPSQNMANRIKVGKWTSRFKGVSKHSSGNWFSAEITHNNVGYYLGIYKTEEAAAIAYNMAAIKLFGEFARANIL